VVIEGIERVDDRVGREEKRREDKIILTEIIHLRVIRRMARA
jgi:hypothetical protein